MNVWAVVLALVLSLQGAPVMHCCHGDKDVIFAWDGDDGSPLAANFINIIDAILGSGTGINGTNALSSPDYITDTGLYAEASHAFPNTYDADGVMLHGDQCGLPRRAFGMGGYFNGKNLDSATADGFFLMQISDSGDDDPITDASAGAGSKALISVKRYGRHLKVETDPDNIDGVVAIVVTNVFDQVTFPKRFIEVIGSISAYDADTIDGGVGTQGDAWVELRIDGVPIVNGDDFEIARDNYRKGVERPCVSPRVSGLTTINSQRGWNIVNFGPQGDADCLYVKEKAAYCNDVEEPADAGGQSSPDCTSPGPGGSSFDGAAQGPRTIHPGGFPVSAADYVAPVGGGISATKDDPIEPQTLTGITTPLVSLDITLCV